MSGRPSLRMVDALDLLLDKDAPLSPYAAAKRLEIKLPTMYRSRLYKMLKAGQIIELQREMAEIRQAAAARQASRQAISKRKAKPRGKPATKLPTSNMVVDK